MSLPDIEIRQAHDGDGEAVGRLIRSVFDEYRDEGIDYRRKELPELGAIASHFRDRGGCLWLAEARQDAIGSANIVGSLGLVTGSQPGSGELLKVYLRRDCRGAGIAGRLLELARAFAQARGLTSLTLWTDTRFLAGQRFYERRGFARLAGLRAIHDASQSLELGYRLTLTPTARP